jgi:hypothetical protein
MVLVRHPIQLLSPAELGELARAALPAIVARLTDSPGRALGTGRAR